MPDDYVLEAVLDSIENELRVAEGTTTRNVLILPRVGTGTVGRFVAVEVGPLQRLVEAARKHATLMNDPDFVVAERCSARVEGLRCTLPAGHNFSCDWGAP